MTSWSGNNNTHDVALAGIFLASKMDPSDDIGRDFQAQDLQVPYP